MNKILKVVGNNVVVADASEAVAVKMSETAKGTLSAAVKGYNAQKTKPFALTGLMTPGKSPDAPQIEMSIIDVPETVKQLLKGVAVTSVITEMNNLVKLGNSEFDKAHAHLVAAITAYKKDPTTNKIPKNLADFKTYVITMNDKLIAVGFPVVINKMSLSTPIDFLKIETLPELIEANSVNAVRLEQIVAKIEADSTTTFEPSIKYGGIQLTNFGPDCNTQKLYFRLATGITNFHSLVSKSDGVSNITVYNTERCETVTKCFADINGEYFEMPIDNLALSENPALWSDVIVNLPVDATVRLTKNLLKKTTVTKVEEIATAVV